MCQVDTGTCLGQYSHFMENPSLIIQKFGGSSLATPEQMKAVAAQVAAQHREGKKLIVVVSAMGKTTDQLIALAHKVSPNPNRRELDMMLTTGERISMALFSMALHDLECPSISFTGSQAGVLTDGSHSNARIIDIKPIRVDEALTTNKVIVLAGFQGVDPRTKEITTLGRGGSDTTAVAMAAHFGAGRCEILKDVDGVLTADPKLVPHARLLKAVDHETMMDMCFWGAKVLHYRSVELACARKVPLFIGRSDTFTIGTEVTTIERFNMLENQKIYAVNSLLEVDHVFVKAASTAEAYSTLNKEFEKHQLPWPQILASAYDEKSRECRYMYTADHETLLGMRQTFADHMNIRVQAKTLSAVSVTCSGGVGTDLLAKCLGQLDAQKISVEKIVTGARTLSFFIAPEHRENAVRLLHG